MATNNRRTLRPRRRRRRLRPWVWVALAAAVLALAGWLFISALGGGKTPAGSEPGGSSLSGEPASSGEGQAASSGGAEDPASDPASASQTEAEQRYQQAIALASQNCTKDAPQVTDPATWNEAGKALIQAFNSDPYLVSEGVNTSAKEGCPYLIAVNRAASTVTVFALDEEGNYTVPYMAMVCSGGEDTPLGFYATPVNYDWRLLVGPSYGQYSTRIWDGYLFHSVPYYSQHKDDIEYVEYNKLGTLASLGCIRLMVVDVKWIYDNCPIGTRVIIYDDAENPGPMGKPGTIYTDPADEAKRGWDPTDPDPANPWGTTYLAGTTIRSEAAWQEYNAAQADGRWNGSITPTDLQGWSTDANQAGTRG